MTGEPLGPLLTQLQLTDSAFPGGLYTLSHGTEAFDCDGPQELAELAADLVRHAAGPGDATALALAHRAVTAGDWPLVAEIDRRLHAVKLNREQRAAAVRTGRQVLETAVSALPAPELDTLAALVRQGSAPGNHAVVVATAHAAHGVPLRAAVTSDLFAFAAGCTSAAVRLGRVDFRQAQAVLHGLAPVIEQTARRAVAARSVRDIGPCTPVADVMAARHERLPARLFTT